MTKFNPENKEVLTYGECLDPAMKITNKEDAEQYFNEYVKFIQKHLDKEPNEKGLSAEQIAKQNLGYYAGYYDKETRIRVENLFACSHPIFGNAANGVPTPEEAFEKGKELAQKDL